MQPNLNNISKGLAAHPSRKWFILCTVLLGATMSALDVSIVNVAMPTLKTTFGVSMSVIEWVAMAYMLTLTIFLPLFGRLADIYGRSKLYNTGFVVFSVGSLFCGMSSSANAMIISRVVQAVGAGLLQANSVALITQAFPANERGKAIGIQGAVQAISMSLGPFVGGILIASAGWRAIFYVNLPIGLLGTIAALLILPPNQKLAKKEKVDYLGTALFASGLACIVLAFNEGVKLGWGSPTIVSYFVSGVVLMTLFILTELKVEFPLIDLKLFKNSTFLLGNITGMLSYYVLFAIMFLMPFYLQKVLGYSVTMTGSLLTPLLLAMAMVAPFSGHISDKYGPRVMTTSGMLVSAAACLTLMLMGTSAHLPGLIATSVLIGLGMGLFIPSNNSAIMSSTPMDKLGMAGGMLNMTRSLGLIFGVNISGMIFTTLTHRYLTRKGYPNTQHLFSNTAIPMPTRAHAFMHGFMVVIMVLLAANVLSALLSVLRKGKTAGVVDHELSGTVVISSGFFNGFGQEINGLAVLVMILLFTGALGAITSSRLRSATALIPPVSQTETLKDGRAIAATKQQTAEAERLALAYYTDKYHDPNVRITATEEEGHMIADVRKYGVLLKRLAVQGNTVTEQGTGFKFWTVDMLLSVN